MKKAFFLIAALAAATPNARPTAMPQYAPGFASHTVQAGGRIIYYRIGGSGPAVLLLHGYGDTGQMWAALAPVLAKTHTVHRSGPSRTWQFATGKSYRTVRHGFSRAFHPLAYTTT